MSEYIQRDRAFTAVINCYEAATVTLFIER